MTADQALRSYNHINERKFAETKKHSFAESLKQGFMVAGILYAANQAAMAGNGKLAAELMNDYRKIA